MENERLPGETFQTKNLFSSTNLTIFGFDLMDSSNLLGLSTFVIAVICFVIGLCIIYYLICPANKRGKYMISRSNIMSPSSFSRTSMMSSFLSAIPSMSSALSRTDRAKKRYERSAWRKRLNRNSNTQKVETGREVRSDKVEEAEVEVPEESEAMQEREVKEEKEEIDKASEDHLDKEHDKDNIKGFSKATGISYLWSPSK